jgi:16S rRNA (guanine527-N7)-methyltransferase
MHARRVTGQPVRGAERVPLPTQVAGLPDLPPPYRAALERGLDRLGLRIPAAARAAIDDHVRLLIAWNAAINLTAIRDPEAIAREHVLDSLSALPLLRDRGVDAFVDLGSGGGFPGIPLAIALPARRALLVESIAKKARFLEAAAGAVDAGGRIGVAPVRAEILATPDADREAWPAVLARAVASLPELVELAFPLLRVGGILVAWKRLPLAQELAAARPALAALGGGPLQIVPCEVEGLADHLLVVASKVRPTPVGFPRDRADRKRGPL